ncbi:MAG: hypothetical protein ACU0BB_05515 [Paracoccaceae bacterium]
MTTQVAEIVTFTLAPNVSDERFLEISQKSEAFCRQNPGFRQRHLSRDADGSWTDYVVWTDMDTAKAAAASFPDQGFAAELMGAIDPDSVSMRHENVLWAI